jgi:polyadenylation factor subunit 2
VAAWHPQKEELFASASHSGQLMFWLANYGHLHTTEKAHFTPKGEPSMVWGMAWHPEGHMLVTTGNDHKLRFWGRGKPNDDKPRVPSLIPGMDGGS